MTKAKRRRETVYRKAFQVLQEAEDMALDSLTKAISERMKQYHFTTFSISRLLYPLVAKGLLEAETMFLEGRKTTVYTLPFQVALEAWLEA